MTLQRQQSMMSPLNSKLTPLVKDTQSVFLALNLGTEGCVIVSPEI